jgi:hypothetical protein
MSREDKIALTRMMEEKYADLQIKESSQEDIMTQLQKYEFRCGVHFKTKYLLICSNMSIFYVLF